MTIVRSVVLEYIYIALIILGEIGVFSDFKFFRRAASFVKDKAVQVALFFGVVPLLFLIHYWAVGGYIAFDPNVRSDVIDWASVGAMAAGCFTGMAAFFTLATLLHAKKITEVTAFADHKKEFLLLLEYLEEAVGNEFVFRNKLKLYRKIFPNALSKEDLIPNRRVLLYFNKYHDGLALKYGSSFEEPLGAIDMFKDLVKTIPEALFISSTKKQLAFGDVTTKNGKPLGLNIADINSYREKMHTVFDELVYFANQTNLTAPQYSSPDVLFLFTKTMRGCNKLAVAGESKINFLIFIAVEISCFEKELKPYFPLLRITRDFQKYLTDILQLSRLESDENFMQFFRECFEVLQGAKGKLKKINSYGSTTDFEINRISSYILERFPCFMDDHEPKPPHHTAHS